MKRIVSTDRAPAAIGPYSQAVVIDGWVYTSGQLGMDPGSGALVGDTAVAQAEQAFRNLGAILTAAGVSFADVVKVTVFMTDLNEFKAVNELYAKVLNAPFPARSCVQVAALPRGARIEIECVARLPGG
jgi:2-iminobutanoate/2-iminopropanoate deaminase